MVLSSNETQQPEQKKQNPLVVVGLILIIVVCVAFMITRLMPKKYPRPIMNYVCENCDARFRAEYQTPPIKCPECEEKKAVRVIKYQCKKCKHIFERRIRSMDDEMAMGMLKCPKCGSDMLMHMPEVPAEEDK
ncbi:hypothetical protein KAW08_01345 [bacterium]|nr:hypothetical protein [bacterium]